MKKTKLGLALALSLMAGDTAFGQSTLKINTPPSNADAIAVISATDPDDPTNKEGLIIPRINAFPGNAASLDAGVGPGASSKGMMVYLQQAWTGDGAAPGTTAAQVYPVGFYYWSGTAWTPVGSNAVTASNGLNVNPAGNVRLGGTLTQATTIDQSANQLNITNGSISIGSTSTANSKVNINDGGNNISSLTDDNAYVKLGADATAHLLMDYQGIQSKATATTANLLALNPFGGNVGIGTNAPTAALDVNGTSRLRSTPTGSSTTALYALGVDASGNVVKLPNGISISGSATLSAGGGYSYASIPAGLGSGVYKVFLTTVNGCGYSMVSEYTAYYNALYGAVGCYAIGVSVSSNGNGSSASYPGTVSNIDYRDVGFTFSSVPGCVDGGNSTGFNNHIQVQTYSGGITIFYFNDGNVSKNYQITIQKVAAF